MPVYLFKIVKLVSSHIPKKQTEYISLISSIFRVCSPNLKKTSGQSFCAFKENKIVVVFSKLIVSLLEMYQQVIFSNSLFIVAARVFKFLHFDATFLSSAKATLKSVLDWKKSFTSI